MSRKMKLLIVLLFLLLTILACRENDPGVAFYGYVWLDTDTNGQQDKGEAPLNGVEVRIINETGAQYSASTNQDGRYSFTLDDSMGNWKTFRVEFLLPVGYHFTDKDVGADSTDSDAYPSGENQGFTDWRYANYSGFPSNKNDAGAVLDDLTHIGDFVWHDLDQDGAQDEGELGVKDIIVTLYNAKTGDEIESTITDEMGKYGFVLSDANEDSLYQLEFILPEGFMFTKKDAPDVAFFRNSDAYPSGDRVGWTDIFTVWPREVNDGYDAGLIPMPPTPTITPTPTPTLPPTLTPTITPTPTPLHDYSGELVDYGDAPTSFPVLMVDGGPYIYQVADDPTILPYTRAYLGKNLDFEITPNIVNKDQFDDGLKALDFANHEAIIEFYASSFYLDEYKQTLFINIVIDTNDNGNWNDPGEWIVQNCTISSFDDTSETNQVSCSTTGGMPTLELDGDHWVRVLLSDWQPTGAHWNGSGPDRRDTYISQGEVEDYKYDDIPTGLNDGTIGVGEANCRYGPSKYHLYKFGLRSGDKLIVEGRNEFGTWLWIQPENYSSGCWISAGSVDLPDGTDIKDEFPISPINLPETNDAPAPVDLTVTRNGANITVAWEPSGISGDDNLGYIIEVFVWQNGAHVRMTFGKDTPSFTFPVDKGTAIEITARNMHSRGYSPPTEYKGTK